MNLAGRTVCDLCGAALGAGGVAPGSSFPGAGHAPGGVPYGGRPAAVTPPEARAAAFEYAGFWRRVAAAVIDGLITGAVMYVVQMVLLTGMRGSFTDTADTGAVTGAVLRATVLEIAVNNVIQWLYFAGFESSANRATPGKMAIGIQVCDEYGDRISFWRATGRHFGKLLSGVILGIGYLMVAFTERKQGLHDYLAGTLVVVR